MTRLEHALRQLFQSGVIDYKESAAIYGAVEIATKNMDAGNKEACDFIHEYGTFSREGLVTLNLPSKEQQIVTK